MGCRIGEGYSGLIKSDAVRVVTLAIRMPNRGTMPLGRIRQKHSELIASLFFPPDTLGVLCGDSPADLSHLALFDPGR